ncbi:thiamine pyrophosphokinase-related protein-like protein [Setomelanomma holmii]|uniref:Thiamine pyrophosphokinase-related protein-like protein n=1 Tax=Setomelanomma holmii TaxID=210430 RepID=A0A9P4H6I2_9PLEO|nr:thiamine pyrophosphokinase-related protein-like protein [Setomelanomma holmii]
MSYSYLDIVKIADAFPYPGPGGESTINDYVHFRVAAHPYETLGFILPDVADTLKDLPGGLWISPTTLAMRAIGRFRLLNKWRGELFPVYGPNKELLFSIEPSASPLFGVVVYGVNMTAFRWSGGSNNNRQGSLQVWVPRRSSTRAKFPNMLDSSVGGGLATGGTPWSCIIRESEEEASLEEGLVRCAQEVGTITYFYVSGEGSGGESGLAQPERSYVFDLDLTGFPPDALTMNDDSVAAFELLTVPEVKLALGRKEFKPNCALVMLDFLIRHGQLTVEEEPGIQEISVRMHRKMDFPLR